jgi:hypothetical protein
LTHTFRFYRSAFHSIQLVRDTTHICGVCSGTSVSVLAVQNMDASGTVDKSQELEFKALEGSLSMMSKGGLFDICYADAQLKTCTVLNDVLDL